MRPWCVYLAMMAAGVSGQTATRTSTAAGSDINGRPAPGPSYAAADGRGYSSRTEFSPTLNGGRVPRESVEEKVISRSGDTVVLERVSRRYDANGNPGPEERTRIEETRHTDGSGTRSVTSYRADINGRLQLAEQAMTETTVSGGVSHAATSVQRPTLNGSLETVEKQAAVRRKTSADTSVDELIVYRKDQNGSFTPASKEVRESVEKDGRKTENTTTYDNKSGGLQLVGQSVARTVQSRDGSESTVTNVFTTSVPGQAADAYSSKASLREQQVTEKRKNADGSVVESTVSRRPNPRDPQQFESSQKIREVVCQGDCSPKQ